MTVKTSEIQLVISGKVQGVSFRVFTQRKAQELGLVGWVRNLRSGEVETYACGSEAALKTFIEWCKQGPPSARVDSVRELVIKDSQNFTNFEIVATK